MRQFVRRGLGATGSCTVTAYDDNSLIAAAQSCAQKSLLTNPNLPGILGSMWSAALEGVSIEGGFVAVIGEAGVADLVSLIGLGFLNQLIIQIGAQLFAWGFTDAVVGAAIGALYGIIGVIIAVVVDLIVTLIQIALPTTVQITNGNTYKVSDYIQNNLQNASNWLNNPNNSVVGLTPLWFANQFDLFLANPDWLYAAQSVTGIPQPVPPTDSGGPLDSIYGKLPGAFELLNRAQLVAATSMVSLYPGKLPFFQFAPNGPIGADPPTFSPANVDAGSTVDPVVSAWSPGDWTLSSSSLNTVAYAACPNLATNNTIFTNGKISQTNPGTNIYVLQVSFPALTQQQCEKIFAAVQPQYEATVAAATAWANQQCYLTAQMLGTGSSWNLEPSDVNTILAQWTFNSSTCNVDEHTAVLLAQSWANSKCPCPTVAEIQALAGLVDPHNPSSGMLITTSDAQAIIQSWKNPSCKTTASNAVTNTLLKGTALVGGLSAIGLAWYAARNGVSVVKAAKMVYGDTKTFAVTAKRKLLRKI